MSGVLVGFAAGAGAAFPFRQNSSQNTKAPRTNQMIFSTLHLSQ
jgi:hypothetical protein